GCRAGRRGHDEPGRNAPRPRQARDKGQHSPQAAPAYRRGVRADPHASRGRRQDSQATAIPRVRGESGAPPPRTVRRQGLSGRPQGRRHPAHRAGRDGRGRFRRDDVRSSVSKQAAAGGGPGGNRARRRHAVRSHGGRRLHDDSRDAPGADQPPPRSLFAGPRLADFGAAGDALIDSSRPKILVVDDAGPVVILCVNLLQALGYAIRAVNRGATALDLCRTESFGRPVAALLLPGLHGFEYDDVYPRFSYYQRLQAEVRDFVEAAVPARVERRDVRVLELACGPGNFTCALAEAGFTVTGLDAYAALVEVAKEKRRARH